MTNLGKYEDLTSILNFNPPSIPTIDSKQLLSIFGKLPNIPLNFNIEYGKVFDYEGVTIQELSWSNGYGPRTEAFLLKPIGETKKLPGVLFLHSHDDVKSFGKEKIVDGVCDLPADLQWVKRDHYGGRGPANELAKRGFAVLVYDCFMWGSRRFEIIPSRLNEVLESDNYERLAIMHESMCTVKYLSLFGTTLAGILNFDDRCALEVAKLLPEISSDSISVIGLSGGGCRTLYLHATSPEVRSAVSIGAMATYKSMIPLHIAPHSHMFFPYGLAEVTDWPGVAMINHSTPLYVQFCMNDQLFTKEGMDDADRSLKSYFTMKSSEYKSSSYPVKHSFSIEMQEDAFNWLKEHS